MLMFLAPLFFQNPCLAQHHQQPLQPQHWKKISSSPFNSAFSKKVNETLHSFHVPGLSISVVHGSETFAEGYGYASISPDIAAGPETLYYAGSTTKAFTAAAISLLVDNGTVNWNTPLSAIIRDDFVLQDEWATNHITLEDALSHRTGLPRHDLVLGRDNIDVKDVIRSLRHLPLTAEPRTRFQYCNLMFATVGHIVETITSQWLGTFLRQHIWEPLGMNGTFFSRQNATNQSSYDLAHGYFWKNETQDYKQVPWAPTDIDAGAGAVISNVLDYAKWLRMMMHRAPPLSASGHAALMKPRSILEPNTMGLVPGIMTGDAVYGLGWFRYTYRGQLLVFHSGSVTGFGTYALYLPDLEWAVTVMANTQGSSNYAIAALVYHLVDEMLGVPESERYDWLKAYNDNIAKSEKFLDNALAILYPDIPSPPIVHSLPLEAYKGHYHHKAYPSFTVNTHDQGLEIMVKSDLIAARIDLEHVSGEHWLATAYNLFTDSIIGKSRAEFKVDVKGKVTEFGFQIDAELTAIGKKTWFKRHAYGGQI